MSKKRDQINLVHTQFPQSVGKNFIYPESLIKVNKKKGNRDIPVLSRSIQPSRGTRFRTFNVDDCNTLHAGLTTN